MKKKLSSHKLNFYVYIVLLIFYLLVLCSCAKEHTNSSETTAKTTTAKEPDIKEEIDYYTSIAEKKGYTELMVHVLSSKPNMKKIDELLDVYSASKPKDKLGYNALMHAVTKANPDIQLIQKLLEKSKWDGNINDVDNEGKSALIHAIISNCSIDIIREMLHFNAKVSLKDKNGYTSLAYALTVADSPLPVIETLLEFAPNMAKELIDGYSAIAQIIITGNDTPEKINLLVNYGSEIDKTNSSSKISLASAIKEGHTDVTVIKKFLAHGASMEKKDCSALNEAFLVETPDYATVEYLLKSGAKIVFNENKDSVLKTAILQDVDVKFIQLLLEYGADVNYKIRNAYYDYLIVYVLIQKPMNLEVAKLLVKAGANVNVKHHYNKSMPIILALDNQTTDTELISLMINAGADFDLNQSPLIHAMQIERFDLAATMIENGVDSNQEFKYGSGINFAVSIGNFELVKLMIDHGASVSEKGLFSLAVRVGNVEIVKLLHSLGLDVNEKVHQHQSYYYRPINYAIENADKEMITLLLSLGASLDEWRYYDDSDYGYHQHVIVDIIYKDQALDFLEYISQSGLSFGPYTLYYAVRYRAELDMVKYIVESGWYTKETMQSAIRTGSSIEGVSDYLKDFYSTKYSNI